MPTPEPQPLEYATPTRPEPPPAESSAWILVRVAVAVPFTLLGVAWLAGGLIMLFKLVQSRQWATTSELMARVGEMLAIFALSAGALAVAIAAIVLPSSRRRIRGGVG